MDISSESRQVHIHSKQTEQLYNTLGYSTVGTITGALILSFVMAPKSDPQVVWAWFVVILSGLGNILGAVAGAFMVALLKVITVEYIGAGWDFVVPSALIMLILIFKPSGIFGSDVRGALDK